MNTRTLTKRPTVQLPTLPRLLLLALFFLAGVLLGQVLSGRVPDTTGDELRRYLEDYVRLGGEGAPTVQTALSALVIYFRYPLFAFLLGFASIGVVLLPCVTAAYGFFLSFSVCCFTAAFGVDGVLLALAVFGLRCMVTLPCYFLLAAAGLDLLLPFLLAPFYPGYSHRTEGRGHCVCHNRRHQCVLRPYLLRHGRGRGQLPCEYDGAEASGRLGLQDGLYLPWNIHGIHPAGPGRGRH